MIDKLSGGLFVYKFLIIVKCHPSESLLNSTLLYSTFHCDNFNFKLVFARDTDVKLLKKLQL